MYYTETYMDTLSFINKYRNQYGVMASNNSYSNYVEWMFWKKTHKINFMKVEVVAIDYTPFNSK